MPNLRTFIGYLDGGSWEKDIQTWLEQNPVAFGRDRVAFRQVQLGYEYRPDFVLGANITVGFTWIIVELKKPGQKIFTKAGKLSAKVSGAVDQIDGYRRWIAENLPYAQGILPEVFQPGAVLYVGRRADLFDSERHQLRFLNATRQVEIRTYDALIDNASRHGMMNDLYEAQANALLKKLPHLRSNVCPPFLRRELSC